MFGGGIFCWLEEWKEVSDNFLPTSMMIFSCQSLVAMLMRISFTRIRSKV